MIEQGSGAMSSLALNLFLLAARLLALEYRGLAREGGHWATAVMMGDARVGGDVAPVSMGYV